MTKKDTKRIIEDILFKYWEDNIKSFLTYTEWYYSDGGPKDKLLEILEIEEND